MTLRLILLTAALVFSAACRRGSGEQPDAFVWSEPLAAGATLHVRTTMGSVSVRSAPGSVARVAGAKRWRNARPGDVSFTTSRSGNDVWICAMWRGSGGCGDGEYRSSVRRRGFNPLALSTWFRRQPPEADFQVDLPAGVRVDASTTSGSVTARGVTGGVVANTVNGAIRIENASGPLAARTVNGSVRVSLDSAGPADSIALRTVNGTVRAELPANIEGRITVSTVNGRISSDFPLTLAGTRQRGGTTQLGTSDRVIRLETVNGSVTLSRRDGAGS